MGDLTLVIAVRRWRYGGHTPEPNANRTCIAVGPDGRPCGRWVNWYAPVGGTARWRHNPRPYGRAGHA